MNVLRVTQGLAEIEHVHHGDLEVTGGVALLHGRVTGDVIIHGGRAVISGIVEGNIDNRGGAVRISGTVLGSITGSPAYTVIDITTSKSGDPFATWDTTPTPARTTPSANRMRHAHPQSQRPLRSRLWTSLTAVAIGIATIGALAAVGDNAAIANASTGDGVAIIQVVEKPPAGN